jgi:hypothetical protein
MRNILLHLSAALLALPFATAVSAATDRSVALPSASVDTAIASVPTNQTAVLAGGDPCHFWILRRFLANSPI